ncbi:replication factor C large subunit [Methanopyrus sp.]
MAPWVEKYRPRSLKELVNQDEAKKELAAWANEWARGNVPEPRAVLLHGPPGTGKTSAAYALAHDFGWDVIELNASDKRTRNVIEKVVGGASTSRSLLRMIGEAGGDYERVEGRSDRVLVLVDEVDGIDPREDRGGVSALTRAVRQARNPVILVANDPWVLPKSLRDAVRMIEFRRLRVNDIVEVLRRICEREGVEYEEAALRRIAKRAKGDLRAAINDLEALARPTGKVTSDDVEALGWRDKEITIFEALGKIFNEQPRRARRALWNLDEDPDDVILWIAQNVPRAYRDPEEIARAYDYLSKADVFSSRAIETGDWRFKYVYATDLMTSGVAAARKGKPPGFVRFQPPKVLRKLWTTRKEREVRDSIARKIAERMHVSTRRAKMDVIPVLETAFRKVADDPTDRGLEILGGIAGYLELSKREIGYLCGDPQVAQRVYQRALRVREELREIRRERAKSAMESAPEREHEEPEAEEVRETEVVEEEEEEEKVEAEAEEEEKEEKKEERKGEQRTLDAFF